MDSEQEPGKPLGAGTAAEDLTPGPSPTGEGSYAGGAAAAVSGELGMRGAPRARRRRKDARPDEILAAALEEFAEKGYAAARLDDVAQRAGVAKGTIYLYYSGKEELFKAVVRRTVMPRLDQIEAVALSYPGTVESFLRGPFLMLQQHLLQSDMRRLLRVFLAEGPLFPDLTAFYYHEVVSRGLRVLRTLIARGVERGELRETGLAELPQPLIAGMLVALLWEALLGRHAPLDTARLLETHVDVLLDGLKKRDG
jgi:AcrR family transcriptional regulator